MAASINPFRTLALHRNFRLFWFGQTLSLIGTWMQSMSLGWLALELTNSAFYVGLVATAGSFPVLLLSMHAGVVVDRVNKLQLVRLCQVLLGLQAATLWWITWSGRATIGWLIVLATANGLVSAFEIPARQSLVIELVGREDLPGAIALNSSGFNLARVVGPSVGAVVIATAGIAWCFGINALSYITVLVGLFMVRLPAWLPPDDRASPLEGIREGIRFMRETPAVAALMRIVTVYSVLGVPYLILMPVLARERLGLNAAGYGLLLSCVGIGGVVGALALAAFGDRFPRGKTLAWSATSFGALLLLLSLVTTPSLAYIILLMTGFSMIVNNALANAMLQHLVPDALRGRIMAAYSFIVVGLSQVIGSFVSGVVASGAGVSVAIGGGAVLMLLYAYRAFLQRPELRTL